MSVSAIFHEWKAAELKFLTVANDTLAPAGVAQGGASQEFNLGVIGSQVTDTAPTLVMSSVASTPARANSFSTITFDKTSVDEDFPVDLTFGPDKLVIPFRGIVWPVSNGSGGTRFFVSA
jgi:hypothetical protein